MTLTRVIDSGALPLCPSRGIGYTGAMLLEVDARNRLSLGNLAKAKQYLVEVDPSGVITLSPAVVMTEMEARLLARPDILAQVEASRASGEDAGRPRRRKA